MRSRPPIEPEVSTKNVKLTGFLLPGMALFDCTLKYFGRCWPNRHRVVV
jgi:hypothetical protein